MSDHETEDEFAAQIEAHDAKPDWAALEAENAGLRKEMIRYMPILQKLEADPKLWGKLAAGTGIATLNGYLKALGAGREGAV